MLRHRARLRAQNIDASAEDMAESMVPSYLHGNLLASYMAWRRLGVALKLFKRHAAAGPVLDFGAGAGVLAELLNTTDYSFVERSDDLAQRVRGTRLSPEALPERRFAAVFALDSLEHNHDVEEILLRLAGALARSGVLILSGPTENALYRLGRRIAGFRADYHHCTIYDIEALAARHLTRIDGANVFGLFRLSVWRVRAA